MTDNKYAEIELKHIQLELKNGRYQHMRQFVDQYFCYKNGYIKKSGTANWEGIVWNETVSLKAKLVTDRTKVVKEHVVPLKRITQELAKLVESKNTSLLSIAKCLEKYTVFGTITKEEDKLLSKNKLHSKMPEEYDLKGHALYQNPHARYIATGIEFEIKTKP